MVKEYSRICDCCKEPIKDMYDFGVTTLYKQIRIGRGCRFNDYQEGTIYNGLSETKPDDYDSYGKGWSPDDNMEFSFCSPECLIKFFEGLYEDTYKASTQSIKESEKELKITVKEFKKKYGEKIPFFQKIQTLFSKSHFRDTALEETEELIKRARKVQKELKQFALQKDNEVIDGN